MIKLLIFLVCLNVALGISYTMSNALKNQVVIDFKNAIVPIISKEIEHMQLDDIKGKSSGIHYEVTKIHVHVNPINPSQINIEFLGGSTLRFSGNSFSMKGTARARAKWAFIRKTVDVSMSISKVSFSTSILLKSVNNKPNIQISQFKVDISSGNVNIKIKGGLIGAVINLIVKMMKGHLVKEVVKILVKKAPGAIVTKVNTILNGLPSDIKITNEVYMKYQFPVAPTIKNGYLLTGIIAYLHPANDPAPPPGPISPMPEIDTKYNRQLQFFVSDYIVRSAVNAAFKLKLMTIKVNRKLDNRQILMNCLASKLPEFRFNNAITASVSGYCTVSLDGDPDPKFQVSAVLDLELVETIKNAVIFFSANKLSFSQLEFKMIKPVDIEWFKKGINKVFAIILEVINGELGQRGIPLPSIKEIDYRDVVQYVGNGFTMVGTTPKFIITMEEDAESVLDYSPGTIIIPDDATEYPED